MLQSSCWRVALIIAIAAVVTLAGPFRARAEVAPKRSVVFVLPPSDELEKSLRDALTAQMSGSTAELVFEHFAAEAGPLRRQVSEVRSLASAYDAVGVFWVDGQSARDWSVYLAEPVGQRVLARRIEVEVGGDAAAVEAVAVIVRESTAALLTGQTIAMQQVDVPPEPGGPRSEPTPPAPTTPIVVPRAPPPPLPPLRASVTLSYVGGPFASDILWQSGARVGASVRARSGLYAGVGYVFYRQANIESPGLSFAVTRTPIDLGAGFAFGKRRLVPAFELRGIFEILNRHDESSGSAFRQTSDVSRTVVFLSPRLRVEYTLSPVLGVYATGGGDFALNGFSYVSRVDGKENVLLDPLRIRPGVELGFLFKL